MAATHWLARQVGLQILAAMKDGHDLDGGSPDAIDDAIRSLDEFARVRVASFGTRRPDSGNCCAWRNRLTMRSTTWSAYGRRETDVLGNRTELIRGLLRPAELERHDARRIRLRMRAIASSCGIVRPASASASPSSIA